MKTFQLGMRLSICPLRFMNYDSVNVIMLVETSICFETRLHMAHRTTRAWYGKSGEITSFLFKSLSRLAFAWDAERNAAGRLLSS